MDFGWAKLPVGGPDTPEPTKFPDFPEHAAPYRASSPLQSKQHLQSKQPPTAECPWIHFLQPLYRSVAHGLFQISGYTAHILSPRAQLFDGCVSCAAERARRLARFAAHDTSASKS